MKASNAKTQNLRSQISRGTSAKSALFAAIALALSGAAFAAPVSIPNSDFSDAANVGTVGGGLIGASGTKLIGQGPWYGTYAGVLGLLAPPLLTISSGDATVSSIGVNALGIGNFGQFDQVLATAWQADKHYVLTADVTSSSLLSVDILTSGNVGLALMNGATVLNSTLSGLQTSIDDLGGNILHVAIGFDSGSASGGNIGVDLFSHPSGVLAAHLLQNVTFRNVHLTNAPVPALPDGVLASLRGTPQVANINTTFAAPLMVKVLDAQGDPLQGVTVTFTPPSTGASINLSSTTAITNVAGIATVTGVANGTAGAYDVDATTPNAPQPSTFHLTNSGNGQPNVTSRSSGDGQSAVTGNAFGCLLSVQVIEGSDPAPGATVVFEAPHSGASATLDDGTNSGESVTTTTDANGVASVAATANNTVGSFSVTATATSLSSGPLSPPVLLTSYPLNNVDPGEQIFADGFEQVPANCASF